MPLKVFFVELERANYWWWRSQPLNARLAAYTPGEPGPSVAFDW